MSNTSPKKIKTSNPFKVLILGGTSDARRLASKLIELEYSVIYSIAGLVRTPTLDCKIHIGGFTSFGGMAKFIESHQVSVVLDATHPYALNISSKAIDACQNTSINYIRFERPAWMGTSKDNWQNVESWDDVLVESKCFHSIFLTSGQVPERVLNEFSQLDAKVYLRTAVKPDYDLPSNINWIKAIGPFDLDSEQKWIKSNQIDLIVSKNSGGQATYGKIAAARELGIKVCMFVRPALNNQLHEQCFQVDDPSDCIDFIQRLNSKISD